MECDVRGKLEAILAEQMSRLLASGSKSAKNIEEAMEQLRKDDLMPEQVEKAICRELKVVCCQRYDEALRTSTRLNGFGWSEGHIKDHMRRFLKEKIDATTAVLRYCGK